MTTVVYMNEVEQILEAARAHEFERADQFASAAELQTSMSNQAVQAPAAIERSPAPQATAANPASDAAERVNDLVESKMKSTGMSRAEAHQTVMRERPQLRAAYVEQSNQSSATSKCHDRLESIDSQWKAAIDAKLATGMNRADATSAVARENPELHQAYIREFNRRHARGGD